MAAGASDIGLDAATGRLTIHGACPDHAPLLSLANGICGISGSIDECATAPDFFLPDAFVTRPIRYHEAFPGYATATDTRLPCPSPVWFRLNIDGTPVDFATDATGQTTRWIDPAEAVLYRSTLWTLADGREVQIEARRIVPLSGGAIVASDIAVTPRNFSAEICIEPGFGNDGDTSGEGADDPRISARLTSPWKPLSTESQATGGRLVTFACDGLTLSMAETLVSDTGLLEWQVDQPRLSARLEAGGALSFTRMVAASISRGGESPETPALPSARFADLVREQAAIAAHQHTQAALEIEGDPALAQAIRFNLFQLGQSASRSPAHSIAAKGLSGEGYEGHYFWDAEAFMLPVLALHQPELARNLLSYRIATLDRAKAHARAMGHPQGALYPWRTIAGGECSSHYPTGSAQYHINGDIAHALEFYVAATGDTTFLHGEAAEMLFETARIWLQIGQFDARRGDAFCLYGVTGPDEYSALVDNDYFTNAIARRHLGFAATTARELAATAPARYAALVETIGLSAAEAEGWQAAADAMWLPVDSALGVCPQDDAFLSRPRLPEAMGEAQHPLLLNLHPLMLFRHQLCKQGDVIQAQAMGIAPVSLSAKARNFAYYEPVTTHDSTLSSVAFAIAAAEIGEWDKARAYHREAALVDLENRHGNSHHGLHMAALAGSWLALVQGWAGLRIEGSRLHFRPAIHPDWPSYTFRMQWQGRQIAVRVDQAGAQYRLLHGEPLDILDHGRARTLGAAATSVERPAIKGVIFDLDGVLTDTAEDHFQAWHALAEKHELAFDRTLNEQLKGVDRANSLRIILEHNARLVPAAEQEKMLAEKNAIYVARLQSYGPENRFTGVCELLCACRAAGLKIGLASASRNARDVIDRIGIADWFDCVADPAAVAAQKPAPDIFLACAQQMGVLPIQCIGVEDAQAGIAAIRAAGMCAIGIGPADALPGANHHAGHVSQITVETLLQVGAQTAACGRSG